MSSDERGSTMPLVLGFFLIALMLIAGGVAAGDAFVQQRGLQDVCDGAAAAAASTAADLTRGGSGIGVTGALRFADVERAAVDYLARDPYRAGVSISATLSVDAETLMLTCTQTSHIAFGAMFGKGDGVRHTATASARALVS